MLGCEAPRSGQCQPGGMQHDGKAVGCGVDRSEPCPGGTVGSAAPQHHSDSYRTPAGPASGAPAASMFRPDEVDTVQLKVGTGSAVSGTWCPSTAAELATVAMIGAGPRDERPRPGVPAVDRVMRVSESQQPGEERPGPGPYFGGELRRRDCTPTGTTRHTAARTRAGTVAGLLSSGCAVSSSAALVYQCCGRNIWWGWQTGCTYLARDLRLDVAPVIVHLCACGPRCSSKAGSSRVAAFLSQRSTNGGRRMWCSRRTSPLPVAAWLSLLSMDGLRTR